MKHSKQPDLKAFFKSLNHSASASRGGTRSAETRTNAHNPSLPAFRLHHQERKERQPCQ